MSAPGQSGGRPDGPYGGAGGYGQGRHPGQYGPPPPPPGQGDYIYSPYGSPSSYRTGPPRPAAPPPRPGTMLLALVLLVLSTLPFLLLGVLILVLPGDTPALQTLLAGVPQTQLTPEQQLSALRQGAGVVVALAAVYLLVAVLAFLGRGWARIAVAVLTGLYLLVLVGVVVFAGSVDAISLAVVGYTALTSLGGVGLLFGAGPREWYAARSR